MTPALIPTTTGRRRNETNCDLLEQKMKRFTEILRDQMAEDRKLEAAIEVKLKDLGYGE